MASTEPISNELAYAGFDCTIDIVNAYYVGVHAITLKQYDDMRNTFFSPSPPPAEKPFLVSSFDVTVPCDSNYVHFKFDDLNKTQNDDIVVEVIKGRPLNGKYSIHFFRGLFKLFSPQTLQFSKAQNRAGEPTIVMQALDGGKKVLYRGDLTNMYP